MIAQGTAIRFTLALLIGTVLTGCTVGPNYVRPQIALTPAYATPATIALADPQWWHGFGDPVLDRIVAQVLSQNLDMAAAAARIDQARAVAGLAHAAMLPAIDVGASAETDHISQQTPFGEASRELGFPRDYNLYQAGAQASWEIDLFGGLRRRQQAARADLAGSTADAAAVRLSVVAEAVDAYLQLRGLQARLAVAQDQDTTSTALVGLIRQRVDQGLSAPRDLNRAIGEEDGVAATIPGLRAGIADEMNRLDVLTGAQAGTSRGWLAPARAIPVAPDPSGASDPSALMRRRPDLVAAEHRLIAANARIGSAMAEAYPKLSLTGLLGAATLGGSSLLSDGAFQASGIAGLRWRLFDFGRIDAEIAQARGQDAEALALYRGSLLRATAEVETALMQWIETRQEVDRREQQVAALTQARDQVRSAYAAGAVALLDVLDADRALLDASDRLAQARAGAARASVAAVRALGGGYGEKA